MKRKCLLILMAAAIGSCHRSNPAEQLAALENAYQSGVITKEEYEAKKSALLPATPSAPVKTEPAPVNPQPVAAPVVDTARFEPPKSDPAIAPAQPAPKIAKAPAPAVAKNNAPPPLPKVLPPPADPPQAPPAIAPAPPPESNSKPSPVGKAGEPEKEEEPAPLAGCEDLESKHSNEKTQERFFAISEARVHDAALHALESLDFVVHKDSPGEIEASKKRHASAIVGAGGERVILRFSKTRKENRQGTLVKAETKKNFVGHLTQKSWTGVVLAQTACLLR